MARTIDSTTHSHDNEIELVAGLHVAPQCARHVDDSMRRIRLLATREDDAAARFATDACQG